MAEYIPLLLFMATLCLLLLGYPIAVTLAGTAILFAFAGLMAGHFDKGFLDAVPGRLIEVMSNQALIAVPLFIFMGGVLKRSWTADEWLDSTSWLFNAHRTGPGISLILAGVLLSASAGAAGAAMTALGPLFLSALLRRKYAPGLSAGILCASGILGQIVPPAIALVMLEDVLSTSYQQAQLEMGVWSPETMTLGSLFAGMLVPGMMLALGYLIYLLLLGWLRPAAMPATTGDEPASGQDATGPNPAGLLLPPLLLMLAVLGLMVTGTATPTEAASAGAMGSLFLALMRGRLNLRILRELMRDTTRRSGAVFIVVIGASVFSQVFRGYGGDELASRLLNNLPGGAFSAVLAVMLFLFLLGLVLDFAGIVFWVVPILAPVLLAMGLDPLWLGAMIVVNWQAARLTPPLGLAVFHQCRLAPPGLSPAQIYRGVAPFVLIHLLLLASLAWWPALATWLPSALNG